MMVEGCRVLHLPHPGTPEAPSESHDWHMDCRDKYSRKKSDIDKWEKMNEQIQHR